MKITSKDSVTIDFIINAPIDVVWNAWTNPEIILNWFGSDPNGTGVCADIDAQPGGSFSVTFQNSDGEQHTCSGTYSEVEPFNKLTFSWEWKSEPGVESFVEVLLIADGNNTKMHFKHSRLGTGSAHDYLPGWKATFEKLDRLLKPEHRK